jgi:hypothetical protein
LSGNTHTPINLTHSGPFAGTCNAKPINATSFHGSTTRAKQSLVDNPTKRGPCGLPNGGCRNPKNGTTKAAPKGHTGG